ncbi:ornithine cyclodeaminase family protein [Clostridiaceae bacterium M8S5]|nr:ornithine cyclodeaminase family protein [Clostridiaceae bacterium M8S5]
MFKVKVLNQEVLKSILQMPMVIEAVEQVYTLKAENKTTLFPMVFHEFETGVADMDIKSGYLEGADIFGLKLVSWYGANKEKGLPLLIGTTMIFDSNTGVPLAILNADHITGMRTGAAGAIGAKYLARKDSRTLLMIGTGHIAQFEIAALLHVVESIDRVLIYDPMCEQQTLKYTNTIKDKLRDTFNITKDINYEAVTDLKGAVLSSDIIITATPSRASMIKKDWVKPGTHISCIGADMQGKQEIDEKLFSSSIVVVDDIDQAINVGETQTAYREGLITKDGIYSEMGEIILGTKVGRKSDKDITIFDSTGIALQDLMTSKIALDIAKERQLGITIDL